MEIVILLAVVLGVILLGRWAIFEGQRIEDKKRFMKNMNKYNKPKSKLD